MLQVDPAFKLPPTAYGRSASSSEDSTNDHQHALPSPTSPMTMANARKDLMAGPYSNNVILPPPPTRARKIIQMKPGQAPTKKVEADIEETSVQAKNGSGVAAGGKKKAGAGTSAGRKIARKTAHSLIERRRRSKMNEEFGVLKDMIPACNGQEMHKLAILQASIDYLRYLEQCVADLKAGGQGTAVPSTSVSTSRSQSMHPETPAGRYVSDEDMDEEMEDTYDENKLAAAAAAAAIRPVTASSTASGLSTYVSPAITASYGYGEAHRPSTSSLPSPSADTYYHQYSQPPYTRYAPATFSVATPPTMSSHASPVVAPQPNGRTSHYSSPMILPQAATVLDHEASAALLMLNASDRRMTLDSTKAASMTDEVVPRPVTQPSVVTKSGNRGMSVKDLLRN